MLRCLLCLKAVLDMTWLSRCRNNILLSPVNFMVRGCFMLSGRHFLHGNDFSRRGSPPGVSRINNYPACIITKSYLHSAHASISILPGQLFSVDSSSIRSTQGVFPRYLQRAFFQRLCVFFNMLMRCLLHKRQTKRFLRNNHCVGTLLQTKFLFTCVCLMISHNEGIVFCGDTCLFTMPTDGGIHTLTTVSSNILGA